MSKPKRTCIFLNTYYDGFLEFFYKTKPAAANLSYQAQLEELQAESFGDSDFYSNGLQAAGWQAHNIIMNCAPLQNAWVRENNSPAVGNAIALEQIRRISPDVVYCQDMHALDSNFLNALRPHTKLIVGQIASSIRSIPVNNYDIIFTSFVQFTEWFRSMGIKSYYQPLAFEKSLIQKIKAPEFNKRPYEFSFVGSMYSRVHQKRHEFLETLANELPVKFWGFGSEHLPPDSKIREKFNSEAWGNKMFEVLFNSKITVNSHGEVTGCGGPIAKSFDENITAHYANNMRLFEATGCGTLLVTDYKDNLNDLFEIGKEVVAYRSTDECVGLIKYYLNNLDAAEKIAKAGQQRTLNCHTYSIRMQQTAEILDRHLFYKEHKIEKPDLNKISFGYTKIDGSNVADDLTTAWKNPEISLKQRGLVQSELEVLYSGKTFNTYSAAANLLRPFVKENSKFLEIGCSSGYYYEILEYLLNKRLDYTGVDYSDAMIKMAKEFYPKANFLNADGANLPFKNDEFSLVMSGAIIFHVPNYVQHIAETVRVASDYVLFHKTPVCRQRPTQVFKKFAYVSETVEYKFNLNEIMAIFASNGLELIDFAELHSNPEADESEISFIFKKVK